MDIEGKLALRKAHKGLDGALHRSREAWKAAGAQFCHHVMRGQMDPSKT